MSASWQGPELEVARRPVRQGRYIGPATVLVWLLCGAASWLLILGVVLAARWLWP